MGTFIIDVAYSGDHAWLAQVGQIFDEGVYECDSLQQLVTAIIASTPGRPLVFAIDHSTIDGRNDAQSEFLAVSKAYPSQVVLAPPTS